MGMWGVLGHSCICSTWRGQGPKGWKGFWERNGWGKAAGMPGWMGKVSTWKEEDAAPERKSRLPESESPSMPFLCICLGGGHVHIPTEEQPDLCLWVRTWHEEEPRTHWEGVSDYFCTA